MTDKGELVMGIDDCAIKTCFHALYRISSGLAYYFRGSGVNFYGLIVTNFRTMVTKNSYLCQ
jgi:hypothetical protein